MKRGENNVERAVADTMRECDGAELVRKRQRRRIPTRSRRWIFGVITIVLAVIVCLTILETVFRVIFFQPKGRVAVPHEFRLSDTEGIPYELTPNHDYEWKYGPRSLLDRGFRVPVHINAQGFRDDPVVVPKPPGIIRILALGDSFTWGLGVPREDGWVDCAESMLRARSGRTVDIINTGVGSWNTEIEAAFLTARGMALQPDAVILGFLVNDLRAAETQYQIDDDGYLVSTLSGSARLHLQALLYEEVPRGGLLKRWVESSHLIRWVSGRRLKTESRQLMFSGDQIDSTRTMAALTRIIDTVRNAGIPLYVCIFPGIGDPISPQEKAGMDAVAALCSAAGVPVARMEDPVAGIPPEDLWVHPRDHHPNARAHRLYAKHIVSRFFHDDDTLVLKPVPGMLREPGDQ